MRVKSRILQVLLASALLVPAFMQHALAGTGVIYITPSSSSLQKGSSETLSLRINPGTNVDGVQATVSYSTAYLQLNSVDTSSSPFNVQLQKSAGGGTITLSLGNLSGGVSSDALIAYMNFTALAGSGSSSLTLSNANATHSGSYTNPSIVNASVSFTTPYTPPPSSGSTSKSTYTRSKTTTSSSAAPTTTAPVPPTVPVKLTSEITSVGYTTANLKITSNQPLKLYAVYGTDKNALSEKTKIITSAAKASITVGEGSALIPGTTYYYEAVGEDSSGNKTVLAVKQFTTTGFTVKVTVLDSANHLLTNQKVVLHSKPQTAVTDADGVATFLNVAPGVHHVEYQLNNKTYSAAVYVDNPLEGVSKIKPSSVSTQTIAAILPVRSIQQKVNPQLAAIAAVATALVIGGLVLLVARLRGRHLAIKIVKETDLAGMKTRRSKKPLKATSS